MLGVGLTVELVDVVCESSSVIAAQYGEYLAPNATKEKLASDLPIGYNLNNFNDFIGQFGSDLFL